MNWFRKSRLGFQLRSIKDNEDVARSLGINVHWAKIKAYAIATASCQRGWLPFMRSTSKT
jgi:branched-chain amino acid transport system permease protein